MATRFHLWLLFSRSGRLTLVIHLSLPRDLSTYLHRVGRTGRFGTVGVSVLVLAEREMQQMQRLLQPMRAQVRSQSPLALRLPTGSVESFSRCVRP